MVTFKKLRQMATVQGNGNMVSKEFTVSSFLQLHLCVNHEIELHHSGEEKVVIELDENLLDYVDVSNSGRTLYITTDTGILKKAVFTSCKVKVYYRQLNVINIASANADFNCREVLNFPNDIEINLQNVGNTTLRVNAPGIKLISKCVGDVILEGNCNSIDIKNTGVGNLNTKELMAGEVVIKNKGVGEINLFASDAITINHQGVGNLFYYGPAILKDVKHNWGGPVQHKDI